MTPLEVLEKVDAFYKTSWDHLIIFGSIAALVIGVVVPLLLQFAQFRLFKREEAAVAQAIKAQVEQAKTSLAETHKQELASLRQEISASLDNKVDGALAAVREEHAKELKDVRQRLMKRSERLTGGVFHVQGVLILNLGRSQVHEQHARAALSLLHAAISEAKAEDEENLVRSLGLLSDECLPNIDKQQLDTTYDRIPVMIGKLEEALTSLNKHGRYEAQITSLRLALKAAQSRERPPSPAA